MGKSIKDQIAPKRPKWEGPDARAEFTPAQRIMREDIAAGRHRNTLPEPIGVVLEGVMGQQTDFTDLAISVIEDGPNLNLSFSQWVIVQGLIEEAAARAYGLGVAAAG